MNILMENTAVLNQWAEYCSGLYNYKLHLDMSVLESDQTPTQEAESQPVLREAVKESKSSKVSRSRQHSL